MDYQEVLNEIKIYNGESNLPKYSTNISNECIEIIKQLLEERIQNYVFVAPCKPNDMVYEIVSDYTECSHYGERCNSSGCQGCEQACDSKLIYKYIPTVADKNYILKNINNFDNKIFVSEDKAKEKVTMLNLNKENNNGRLV